MAPVDGVDVMLWPIPDRVGTPNTAFLVPAMAVLECISMTPPSIHDFGGSFSSAEARPRQLIILLTYSISLLASIPLDAGSDKEDLALKVPILSTLYLG
jgi:hypothetical protein